MESFIVHRPGNAPLKEEDMEYILITTFDDIALE